MVGVDMKFCLHNLKMEAKWKNTYTFTYTQRAEECPPKIHVHLEPQNVILSANWVFAQHTQLSSYWIRVGQKSNDWLMLFKKATQMKEVVED
jgi:hypothetical protein